MQKKRDGPEWAKVSQELAKMSQERARMSQNLPGLLWMVPAVEGVSRRGFGLVFVVSATSKGEVMLSQAWYKMIIKRERKLNSGKFGQKPPIGSVFSGWLCSPGQGTKQGQDTHVPVQEQLRDLAQTALTPCPSPAYRRGERIRNLGVRRLGPAPLPRTGEGSSLQTGTMLLSRTGAISRVDTVYCCLGGAS